MTTSALAAVPRHSFNHDKAIKGFGERRPQNARYEAVELDIWTYFDAEDEGLVEWRILSIADGQAKLMKLTGRDAGYTTMYELSKMDAKRWKPKDAVGLGTIILWPCPDCGGDNPIRVGDYMCIKCRELLDSGA